MNTEKQTLLQQRENTAFLLTDVIPWMLANPERVELGVFNTDCGTLGCVLGWYSLRRHSQTHNERCDATQDSDWEESEFGVWSFGAWIGAFGGESSGTLQERTPRIQKHLDELDAKIAAL